MNYKKLGVYTVFALLAFSVSLSFVSASDVSTSVTDAMNSVSDAINPILQWVFGSSGDGNEMAMRGLTFLLVAIIVYGILDTIQIFGTRGWVNFLVGIIVAVIGIRFLPAGFLQTMALPSSALVALLVLGIPFIIAFVIIEKKILSKPARRVAWVLFGAMIFVLWIYNWSNPALKSFNWIYILFFVLCLIMLALDGTIQKWWNAGKLVKLKENVSGIAMERMMSEYAALQRRYADALQSGQNTEASKVKGLMTKTKKAIDAMS